MKSAPASSPPSPGSSRRRRGSHLLWRIALGLVALGLLPLGLSSWQLVRLNRDAMTQQALRSHSLAARSTAERLEAFLDARLGLARATAAGPALADPSSSAARQALTDSLQAWSELHVLAVALVDAHGEELVRAQLKSDPARQAAEAARGLPPWPEPRALDSGAAPLLVLDAPLGTGALRLLCDGTGLVDLLHPRDLGEDADLLVVDRDRELVAGSAASLADLPATLLTAALSGRTRGAQEAVAAGEPVLSAWSPVEGTSWTVISRQPVAVAEAAARRMRDRAAIAVAGAIALIAVLAFAAWVSIVRPLRGLLAAQQVLTGAAASRGGGEIAQLEAGFAELERSLRDRDDLSRVFLGRYQVVEMLGRGGMGMVFRGWDPKLERPVALKTVRLDKLRLADEQAEQISVLRREALTVAKLNHHNIVAVYDLEQTRTGAFIAMELVEGHSLAQVLHQRARVAPEALACLALAVVRGLGVAHAHGIVHRDIKPANVLLGRDGSIKVTDFGIAAFVSSAAGQASERIFGTPGFVPPEVFRGEPYSAPGDLFALGVVLYVALTGREPFGGRSLSEIAQRTVAAAVPPVSRYAPGVPAELESLVLRLLERDPARRPATAILATELEELVRRWSAHWTFPDLSGLAAGAAPFFPARTVWQPTLGGASRRGMRL